MNEAPATTSPEASERSSVLLSIDQVADATHPAILRAIEGILRDGDTEANFSNFYSHQSFGNISDGQ